MDNAFCTKCGARLAPGTTFCTSCGQAVNNASSAGASSYAPTQYPYQQQPQPQVQYNYPYVYQPKTGGSKSKLIAIICAAAVVVIAAVLLIVLLSPPNIDPRDLNGTWDGTLKVTQISSDSEDYGVSDEYVGERQETSIAIDLDKNGKGTLTPNIMTEFDAKYQGGRITAKGESYAGYDFSMEGGVSKKGDGYAINGTWKLTDGSKIIASGTWTAEMGD